MENNDFNKVDMIHSELENLTENQKLELFKVEELETRLEMAAVGTGTPKVDVDVEVDANGVCWIG